MKVNDDQTKKRISTNIRRLLSQQGRSVYWLSKQTGEYQSTLANIVSGENNPGAGLLKRISEALGVTTDSLYENPPPRRRKNSEKVRQTA